MHDLSGNTQSDTGTGRFGREEWDKDTFLNFNRYACPVVAYPDKGFALFVDAGRQFDLWPQTMACCIQSILLYMYFVFDNIENKLTLYLWYLFAMCIICFLQRKNTPDYLLIV
jgi:hypothetical protein